MAENENVIPEAEETALTAPDASSALAVAKNNPQSYVPTMWNDPEMLKTAWKTANFLASSDLVPEQTYKGKPANCLVALDISNRMNISPLLVMQSLYIVKGKPSWSGQFCASAINGCGRFTPIDYVMNEDKGGSCYATAIRKSDNQRINGSVVSIQMAKDEGWYGKTGSKWQTMPEQMLRYRAAAFFARAYCPDVLLGIMTYEEAVDVYGAEEPQVTEKVKFALPPKANAGT